MNFWLEEYDAGGSPSKLKEVEWRTTHHPVRISNKILSQGGHVCFDILKTL